MSTHYNDVTMSAMASLITGVSFVYSTVCPSPDQRKHQRSAWLAFVRVLTLWPVNSPHKGPVARKIFQFVDVIMVIQCRICRIEKVDDVTVVIQCRICRIEKVPSNLVIACHTVQRLHRSDKLQVFDTQRNNPKLIFLCFLGESKRATMGSYFIYNTCI